MGVDGTTQAADIGRQAVVTDLEPRLGAVGVAQIRQPQRGGIRQIEGALAGLLERQIALAPLQEGVADGWRGAEQIGHQPAEAVDVADQPHVLVGDEALAAAPLAHQLLPLAPEAVRHGEVEVHPGDHLHQAAVAVLQPLPVEGLHPADVGAAVLGQPDVLLVADEAGHGQRPDPFITEMVDGVTVDVAKLFHQAVDGVGGRRDELQQALRVVGGDVGMGQRRAQTAGVIGLGQGSFRGDAQTFTFDPAPDPLEAVSRSGEPRAVNNSVSDKLVVVIFTAHVWPPHRGRRSLLCSALRQLQRIDGKMKLLQGFFKLLLVPTTTITISAGSSQRAALALSVSADTVLIRLFWPAHSPASGRT